MTAPAAVLWDMDGTLTDTEPLWLDAEQRLADRYGARWGHEDALAVVGTPLLNTARVLHERGVELPPERIVRVMAQEVAERIDRAAADGTAPWHRGAIELAAEVAAAGIPQALVTSSPIEVAQAGARVIAVETALPVRREPGLRVVGSLGELDLADLDPRG